MVLEKGFLEKRKFLMSWFSMDLIMGLNLNLNLNLNIGLGVLGLGSGVIMENLGLGKMWI